MKTILLIMSLLALTSCAGPQGSGGTVKSFLIVGQSNNVSLARTDHAPYFSQTGLVSLNDQVNGQFEAVTPLRIPTSASPMPYSISWIYLGDMIGGNVQMYNLARGGTSVRQWRDDLAQGIYQELRVMKFDAILWGQGETDFYNGTTADDYYNDLKTVIVQAKAIQNVNWYIAINSDGPQGNPVRVAQQRLIDDGYALQGPDTDTIRNNPAWVDSIHQHFIGDGLRVHAEMWYNFIR